MGATFLDFVLKEEYWEGSFSEREIPFGSFGAGKSFFPVFLLGRMSDII